MLAHVLAVVVGLGSFTLYMAAFFLPEVYRKNDFIWSGIAMFYALVLWVYADRIDGGLLLGQVATVALLGWLGYQSLQMRRQLTPFDQQTRLPGGAKSFSQVVQNQYRQLIRKLPLPGAAQLEPKPPTAVIIRESRPKADSIAPASPTPTDPSPTPPAKRRYKRPVQPAPLSPQAEAPPIVPGVVPTSTTPAAAEAMPPVALPSPSPPPEPPIAPPSETPSIAKSVGLENLAIAPQPLEKSEAKLPVQPPSVPDRPQAGPLDWIKGLFGNQRRKNLPIIIREPRTRKVEPAAVDSDFDFDFDEDFEEQTPESIAPPPDKTPATAPIEVEPTEVEPSVAIPVEFAEPATDLPPVDSLAATGFSDSEGAGEATAEAILEAIAVEVVLEEIVVPGEPSAPTVEVNLAAEVIEVATVEPDSPELEAVQPPESGETPPDDAELEVQTVDFEPIAEPLEVAPPVTGDETSDAIAPDGIQSSDEEQVDPPAILEGGQTGASIAAASEAWNAVQFPSGSAKAIAPLSPVDGAGLEEAISDAEREAIAEVASTEAEVNFVESLEADLGAEGVVLEYSERSLPLEVTEFAAAAGALEPAPGTTEPPAPDLDGIFVLPPDSVLTEPEPTTPDAPPVVTELPALLTFPETAPEQAAAPPTEVLAESAIAPTEAASIPSNPPTIQLHTPPPPPPLPPSDTDFVSDLRELLRQSEQGNLSVESSEDPAEAEAFPVMDDLDRFFTGSSGP